MSDLPFDLLAPVEDQLDLTPMVIAIEWDEAGRTWPGRTATFRKVRATWWTFVIPEVAVTKHVRGGWLDAARLRPGHHAVITTHLDRQWGTWSHPVWPEGLEHLAAASWNRAEHRRARV